MKNFIFAAGLALAVAMPVYAADAKPETRKVCVDVKDKEGKVVKNKDGSAKQNCKEVKVHQKHEGTKVPEKK
jgi:azurin